MNTTLANHDLMTLRRTRWSVAISLIFFLLTLGVQTAYAATLRWTGGHATSSDWSRGANWDTGTAPANDDTLVFPAGAARLSNNNDLTGLRVAVIRFTGVGGGYTLSGNGVNVTDGISAINVGGANTNALARVTLGGPAFFTVAQPGTLLLIESEVRLNGNNLTVDSAGELIVRGVISGNGNIRKIGFGYLALGGVAGNTFAGDVFVDAGQLFMGKLAGLAVPQRLVVGENGAGAFPAFAINSAEQQVNQVTVNASGVWSLNGHINEVSDLLLDQGGDVTTGPAGKLRLGSGAGITVTPAADASPNISSINGNLELAAGAHVISIGENTAPADDPGELIITADINGIALAGFTKEGAGDLELRGNNSFGGAVSVNEGELRVGHAAALGATGSLAPTTVNNAASLRVLDGVDVDAETLRMDSTGALRGVGTCSWTGDLVLLRNTRISVASGGDFTLRGTISGTGNIEKENTGLLRIGGNAANNTFNGDLLVNEGTVELDKGTIGGLVAVPGRLIVGDGVGGTGADVARLRKDNQVSQVTVNGSGLWDLGAFEEEVANLTIINGGDVATAPTGLLRLGIGANVTARLISGEANLSNTANVTGNLELMAGLHTFIVDRDPGAQASGNTLAIFAGITGIGGIIKEGVDLLQLVTSNSFAGRVEVNAGHLMVVDKDSLGSSLSGTQVNGNADLTLFFNGVVSGETLVLDTTGLITAARTDTSWAGNVTLLRDASIKTDSTTTMDFSGVISGSGGLTKTGLGTLLLSGNAANNYTGVTTVNEGRLQLNKALQNVAVPGRLIIGDDVGGVNADAVECLSVNEVGATSTVTVNSSGQWIARQESIGALAGSGNITISGSLNVGNVGTATVFHGVISGTGAVNKIGTGTLTFNGDNTYTGGTGIADGTLFVNGQQPAGFVLIQPAGTLGGSGRVGSLSTFAGGATVSPGASPGRLSSGNVIFGAGTVFRVELDGPVPGTQYDQLRAFGTVNLGGATLQPVLNFIPTLGQPLVIIDNDGTDDVIDEFNGLAEGDTIRLNQIPFVISYEGGDGNDVTLTATNTSIAFVSTRVEAGNGNGVIDPNECNHLFVALMNETGGPLGVSRVVLDSATPGVVVTQQRSDYANFAALGIRTNGAPFQIRTAPDFECGRLIEFLLTVTVTGGGGGTFTIPFTVPSGGAGTPVEFNNAVNTPLVDQGQLVSALNVSGAAPLIGKVTVSLHITHPSAGDLVLRLQSPSGTVVPLALNLGGTTDNYGGGCGNQANRTTFDDDAAIRIAAGTAPFIGSFTPDSPLAAFRGEDPNGDWKLLIADTVAGDTGELRCWSLLISPPECSDGGGQCETCVPNFSGRFNADMPSTTTRLVRNGVPGGCGNAKVCPTVTTGARLFYRVHLVTNTGPANCVSVVLNDLCRAGNLRLHAAAYLNSYNPADPCANYLGDTGTELTTGSTSFSFAAPENAVIAIVVSSPVTSTTCPISYGLQLHGLPCPPPTLYIEKTANPDEVRLFWSTAYPDFDLQRTPTLNGAAPYPFVNVPFTPFVVNGDYSVTNSTSGADAYYRLRKP